MRFASSCFAVNFSSAYLSNATELKLSVSFAALAKSDALAQRIECTRTSAGESAVRLDERTFVVPYVVSPILDDSFVLRGMFTQYSTT